MQKMIFFLFNLTLKFFILEKKRKNKAIRVFTEGWVEFKNKKYAKRVAKCLNNQPVRGKRHNPWFDELWNIK
jgi:ESF2/ABP1 family protein